MVNFMVCVFCVCMNAKLLQLCMTVVTLWTARLLSPWGFSSKSTGVGCHALLQGTFLTQGSGPHVFCLSKQILYHWCQRGSPSNTACAGLCLVAQSRPTLCESMDCSPPGSSIHADSPARILEWVAMPSSRGSSQPRD